MIFKNVLNKRRVDITIDNKYSIHEVASIFIYFFTKEYYISSVNNNVFTFLKISELFERGGGETVSLSFINYKLNSDYLLCINQDLLSEFKKRIILIIKAVIGFDQIGKYYSEADAKFVFGYTYDILDSVSVDNKLINDLNSNNIDIKEKAIQDLIKLQNNTIKKIIFYDTNKNNIKDIFYIIVDTFECYRDKGKIKFDNIYKLNNILQCLQKEYHSESIVELINCLNKMQTNNKYSINNIIIKRKSEYRFVIKILAFKLYLNIYDVKLLLNTYSFTNILLNIIENGGGIEKLNSMIIQQRLLKE